MFRRKLYYELQKYLDNKEALVITGMRQVGKTTLLKQIYDEIESGNKLFLDLENVLNQAIFEEVNYDVVDTRLRQLCKSGRNDRLFVFIDEIQNIKKLPSIIKYLGDHFNYKFFLTGSVSFYLRHLFSESLAGRKFLFQLSPLSFSEFMDLKKVKFALPKLYEETDKYTYEKIQPYYSEYVEFGAFPGVVLADGYGVKESKLNEIFSSYFQKEVVQFADFRKNTAVRDLMLLLLNRSSAKIETAKLCSELGVSRITLNEYIAFLEGSFFIKLIRPYSRNLDTEIRETPKIYSIDSGLANIIGKASRGSVFENAVFHELNANKKGAEDINFKLNYYRKKNGQEIDFILNQSVVFEVKHTADVRDVERLKQGALKLKIKESYVISYNYSKDNRVRYGFQL